MGGLRHETAEATIGNAHALGFTAQNDGSRLDWPPVSPIAQLRSRPDLPSHAGRADAPARGIGLVVEATAAFGAAALLLVGFGFGHSALREYGDGCVSELSEVAADG
jgi:hypothetical protein